MARLKRAGEVLALAIRRRIRIRDREYAMRPFYANRMATAVEYEGFLDDVYRTALGLVQGTFVDVGANTGQTLIKLLALDRERSYVGFEPQASCCFFIEQFLIRNRLRGHQILPMGLSNRSSVLKLHMRVSSLDTTASLVERFRPGDFYSHFQYVPVVPGDEILGQLELEEIAIVKIDVEGGELEVIEGMLGTLERCAPFVVFEVLNHFLVGTGEDLDEATIAFRDERTSRLCGLLHERNYSIYNIRSTEGLRKVRTIVPERSDDQTITDYVAVPNELEARFAKEYPRPILD